MQVFDVILYQCIFFFTELILSRERLYCLYIGLVSSYNTIPKDLRDLVNPKNLGPSLTFEVFINYINPRSFVITIL